MDEQEFLEGYDPSAFDRPSVTVDLVLVGLYRGQLSALLLRRSRPPQSGRWALPGGFVAIDESLDQAAARLLREKVGVAKAHLEQLYTFGAVSRDPRMRIITVAYLALLRESQMAEAVRMGTVEVATLTAEPLKALDMGGAPLSLAFDHREILTLARDRLRNKIDYSDVAFALLPDHFTLRALQNAHEAILGIKLNKPAFRRRVLDRGRLIATGVHEQDSSHRPAELYRLRDPS